VLWLVLLLGIVGFLWVFQTSKSDPIDKKLPW